MPTKSIYINRILKSSFLFFFFLLIISCSKEPQNIIPHDNVISSDSVIHNNSSDTNLPSYLALGDSYTIGQSVPDSERFPVQVVNILRKKNVTIADPDIIAVTGWTTADLLHALHADPPSHTYSFVSLLIGVNNQYQGRSLEEYKKQFTELLNLAIIYSGNHRDHVFVISIPDYSVTPFAYGSDTARISKEIDNFNEVNKTISLGTGVSYIDITPISRGAKNDPSLIASDGLHPSASQYYKWASLMAPLFFSEIH